MNHIKTTGGYDYFTPYKPAEEALKKVGFDVLVFIPSIDEDEGRITCGNAILSGTMPHKYKFIGSIFLITLFTIAVIQKIKQSFKRLDSHS